MSIPNTIRFTCSFVAYYYLRYTMIEKTIELPEGSFMPEISRFYGIVVKMIYNDNDKHHKPHVHVYYGEYEASVSLDGLVLEGRIPAKQYRILAGWMAIHEEELYAAWNNAVRSIPFDRIEPLR